MPQEGDLLLFKRLSQQPDNHREILLLVVSWEDDRVFMRARCSTVGRRHLNDERLWHANMTRPMVYKRAIGEYGLLTWVRRQVATCNHLQINGPESRDQPASPVFLQSLSTTACFSWRANNCNFGHRGIHSFGTRLIHLEHLTTNIGCPVVTRGFAPVKPVHHFSALPPVCEMNQKIYWREADIRGICSLEVFLGQPL